MPLDIQLVGAAAVAFLVGCFTNVLELSAGKVVQLVRIGFMLVLVDGPIGVCCGWQAGSWRLRLLERVEFYSVCWNWSSFSTHPVMFACRQHLSRCLARARL
jgi:hypothetical protein